MKYPMETWKWHGLAGHFCMAHKCHFRLHTQVGPYKISTVGALYPDKSCKRMEEIGLARDYETYVFTEEHGYSEIDSDGISLARDAGDDPYKADELAEEMHMKMCLKYAKGEL